ncbi:acyl-CoA dehydrogenase family protein [Candidatus Entotheonella palauensis]|uniref:acyl-CoA dehydrogenase family protein n=1 Tax=Candidatus Entotheonella palauensis TaxID=93172 RepID=UPI000B7C839F|nr:acyl-CoA dehydrogenase family protein [Candidatus Entotheonella palauensis]
MDASSGWCVMIGATTIALQAVFLPDEAISQMFVGGRMPTAAGALMPTGEAIPEPGGYRVSGRWAFASGIHHAEWVNATVRVRQSQHESEVWRRVVLPVSSVTIHDNWDAVGLKGTGSCDFSVSDCFVSSAFSWGFEQVPRRGGRLYHLGLPGFAANEHAAFALGVARHALDLITDRAVSKSRGFHAATVASRSAFQRDLGEWELQWRAARAMVFEVFETAWQTLCAGREPSPASQAEMRGAATLATRMALEIVTQAFRYAGGEAVYGANVLQRCWRDLNTAAQHFMVSDTAYENHGKFLLKQPDAKPFG